MKKLTLFFSLFVLSMSMLFAQTVQITGTVTDEQEGTPIPGASIVAVGTTIGTTTDVNGYYSLIVPTDVQKLEFSFIGMQTVEVDIAGRTEINMSLAPDIFGLDEVIVTGVASIDTEVASHIMKTVQEANLLGANCVLTGIRPEVAQTVIHLGLDLENYVTKRDMQEGLKFGLEQIGYEIGRKNTDSAD